MPHHDYYDRDRNKGNDSNTRAIGRPWHNDIRDTTALLEQKLFNYIRLNPRLRENVSRTRLLKVTESGVEVDLIEFSEPYRAKFIDKDMDSYCLKFIEQVEPTIAQFLYEVQFSSHCFKFTFRLGRRVFEKLRPVTSKEV